MNNEQNQGVQPTEPTPTPEACTDKRAAVVNARIVAEMITSITADGMFPLVAYGLDPRNRPEKILLVTSSIPDMVLAQDMLHRYLGEDYNLGRFVPYSQLDAFARNNRAIVKPFEPELPGFNANEHARLLGTIARDQAASRWKQKAFGLVDVSGFSLCTIEQQLAHRTSLALALRQAAGRVNQLYVAKYLPGYAAFCSAPTGDGFYFWHRAPGGAGDVAVFMLLIYLLTQAEAMRSARRSSMRLRCAFAVGEAYTFPSRELESFGESGPMMQDAIGPVLNSLARMVTAAKPGQLLIGDFNRPGRADREETLTPAKLVEQAKRQLLPSELKPGDKITPMDIQLDFAPTARLRLEDKHGNTHYCWNVVGATPNRFKGESVMIQGIGLPPESTLSIHEMAFADPGAM